MQVESGSYGLLDLLAEIAFPMGEARRMIQNGGFNSFRGSVFNI